MRTEVSTVPTARGLSCLDLLDRDLGPFELVLILALLKVNTTMNTVNLNGNPRLEARPFLTALLALEHIKMLGDLKAFPLRQVAQSNTREMQLEKVGLGEFDARVLAEAAEQSSSLQRLVLTSVTFSGPEAVDQLVRACLRCSSLQEVNALPLGQLRRSATPEHAPLRSAAECDGRPRRH